MTFPTLPSPDGPVHMAFGSHELAAAVVLLYGVAANIFLLPETELTPELRRMLEGERVVVFQSSGDYNEACRSAPGFRWADRVIRYSTAAP